MNKQGKIIIALLVVGLALFISVQFIIIPKQNAVAEQYELDQRNPLTHDLENILKYKHPYMGSAGNLTNLFRRLPMTEAIKDFELLSDDLTLIVNYHLPIDTIGTKTVNQSLIYNSTAAFSLIGNLEKIHYNFSDKSFVIHRESVESLYDDFGKLTSSNEIWNQQVRNPLGDAAYTKNSLNKILEN